jgi:hypothetical protein
MNLDEITDLHNRRTNLDLVATRAKKHVYPLLIWPEDKLLVRLSDLPWAITRQPNCPESWLSMHANGLPRPVRSDSELREMVRVDYAYAIVGVTNIGTLVQEFRLRSF